MNITHKAQSSNGEVFNPEAINPYGLMSQSNISEFDGNIQAGLKTVVKGEREAIEDISSVLISGENLIIGGASNAAKSLFMNALAQLVGASERQVASVQGLSDPTPSSIVGSRRVKTIVQEDGSELKEILELPGEVNSDTVMIKIDEWPRLSKRAREAFYPIMAEASVRNIGVEYDLDKLIWIVGTANKPERRDGIEPAEARRYGAGTIFDAEPEEVQESKSIMLADSGDLHQVQFEPITNPAYVKAIQNTVRSNKDADGEKLVKFPHTEKKLAYKYQKFIQAVVQELNPKSESTSGMSPQMGRLAIAKAAVGEEKHIEREHVLKAAELMLTSRVIQLGHSIDNVVEFVGAKKQKLAAI
jgi:MoxR-like ATPase